MIYYRYNKDMLYDTLLLSPLIIMIGILYWDLFSWDREYLFRSCASSGEQLILEYNKECQKPLRSNSIANASRISAKQDDSDASGSTSRVLSERSAEET